jgi:RNA polymerase sigma-70 factor, ECF subfamily
VRAIEHADQFTPGARQDRSVFAILRSIWLSEVRPQRIREGGGLVEAGEALTSDRAHAIGVNNLTDCSAVSVGGCPEA